MDGRAIYPGFSEVQGKGKELKRQNNMYYIFFFRVNNRKKTDFCFWVGKKLFFSRTNIFQPMNCFVPANIQAYYLPV